MPFATITRRDIPETPVLLIQRTFPMREIQQHMAECFGTLFGHGVQASLAIGGQPTARYLDIGPGDSTVQFIMPLTAAGEATGEMQPGMIGGGPVAFTTHNGPYEQLGATHAAVQEWISSQSLSVAGPPWECYVTDPGATPDPADYRTEVFWPVAS